MAVDNSSVSLKDTFIDQGTPTLNWGTDVRLIIGGFGSGFAYRSLVQFTTPNLSGTITQVDLVLRGVTAFGSLPVTNIHTLTQTAFTEAGATWNKYDGTNNWTAAGGDYDSTIIMNAFAPSAGSDLTINLYGNGAANPITPAWNTSFYFLIKASDEVSVNAYAYSSRRGSNAPYLSITYTAADGISLVNTVVSSM